MTPDEGTTKDWLLGFLLVFITLEVARRTTGWLIPLMAVFMFVYVFLGRLLPGMWAHPGFNFEAVIESAYYSERGIYGSITGYSATFVAVFLIFGSLLMITGGGKTFIDLALLIAGRFRGGPAKVAIVASALFGTISGSPVANVSVTGNYTIPLMKKLGYSSNFAGGVEAMASTGGIITPPIMGIAAFIMAELIGVPYIKIIGYAIIPCLLYYVGIFAGTHFEALRLRLAPVPKGDIPHWRTVLKWSKIFPLFAPIAILVWLLLLQNFSLIESGFYSCVSLIIIYFFSDFSLSGMKQRLVRIGGGLSEGGKSLATIVPIMVTMSMFVNLMGMTGVAPKLTEVITNLGAGNLMGALATATVVPLILGIALPATAAYILSAAFIAPALLEMGIDLVSAHMFLIYWCALSAITPPTCAGSVVAAKIAGGDWLKVSFTGMKLGIIAFIMPILFVLEPALLGRGAPVDILKYTASAVVGCFILASGLFGYLTGKINVFTRVLLILSGLFLLYPSDILSIWGLVVAALAFAGNWLFAKLSKRAVAAHQA